MRSQPILILIFLAFGVFTLAQGQTLPAERATDWTLAGYKGSMAIDYPVIDFVARGGVTDGVTPNDAVYSNIIDSLNGSPAVIYFPPGDFFFTGSLVLQDYLILRGASAQETILRFDLGGSGHLILASGSVSSTTVPLTENPSKDDYAIALADASGFGQGDQILLMEEDDDLVTSDWALRSTGQIIAVESVSGNTLQLRSPLRRSYETAKQASVALMQPVRGIGIEQLTVIRMDATSGQTSNIMLQNVSDSWISCVESYNSNFGHMELRRCTNIDIEGCFMQDAFAYGGGGQGYGVVLHSTTGECLITGNRFNHLRHSMLLQSGANGNVLSYNYSRNPFWTDVLAPANSAGDLVLHGNYPYLNLMEGNDVAHIVIDDSHGKNGPYNTIFRNRAHLYGIFMSGVIPSPGQNLIGNEVTNLNPIMGFYLPAGANRLEFGNNIRGQIIPAGTSPLPEQSLYLESAPGYYLQEGTWPPIGIPNVLNSHSNEAKDQYDQGYLTQCAADLVLSTALFTTVEIAAFPNPASTVIHLLRLDGKDMQADRLELFSPEGKMVRSAENTSGLSVAGLASGLYILRAILPGDEVGVTNIVLLGK